MFKNLSCSEERLQRNGRLGSKPYGFGCMAHIGLEYERQMDSEIAKYVKPGHIKAEGHQNRQNLDFTHLNETRPNIDEAEYMCDCREAKMRRLQNRSLTAAAASARERKEWFGWCTQRR
jgi:hypothetical protein